MYCLFFNVLFFVGVFDFLILLICSDQKGTEMTFSIINML